MKAIVFDCSQCGGSLGPFRNDVVEIRPHSCTHCQSSGPFKVNTSKTQYGNYQKITLQESPGSVPPGRVPRYKDVILLGDLIDIARPGEEVEVTGVYRHSQGFSDFKFPVLTFHSRHWIAC
jgi:DNA replication licensing factor MCM2